jgi:hypothetical protein
MKTSAGSESTAREVRSSTTFRRLARSGFVVLGILHILIGAIAISMATGAGGGEADQGGAMQQIQKSPVGVALLWSIVT